MCAYKLTVEDCAKGLSQGLLHGWLDLKRFNIVEYEHYEQVENGDLNWTLPGKFISFAGPHNERRRDNGYVVARSMLLAGRSTVEGVADFFFWY